MNQLTRFNRVRYTIYGKTFGSQIIEEPSGWQLDNLDLMRSSKFDGIMTVLNSKLEFYGIGSQLLKGEYDVDGIKAVVRIEREERNELTDIWELNYSANFDFKTYKQNKNYIQIETKESEFFSTIESRFKDNYELERLKDLKNGILQPLEYKKLSFQGTEIFRPSLFRNDSNYFMYKNGSDFVVDSMSFPLPLIYKSDENVSQFAISVNNSGQIDNETAFVGEFGATIGQFFYITAVNTRDIRVKIKGDFKFQYFGSGSRNITFRFSRFLYEAETGFSDPIYENLTPVFELTSAQGQVTKSIDVEFIFSKRIKECFQVQGLWAGNAYPLRIDYNNASIELEETQSSVITDCNALTYYQVFERLFQIVTGKNTFQSTLLSTTWKDLLFTNGFKIRQVPDKNITTSLEEVYNSLAAIDDICLIIKNNTVRIEKKSFVYDRVVGIDLGKVVNIEREIDEKNHFSSVEIGCDFNGLYEEVNGLEEYNIRTSYMTCLTELDNKFSAISKVRFDGYGMTLAQEKQYIDNPKLDTKYDKFNFGIDCKLVNGIYLVRHYEDDFDEIPTGIFSPSTAINLRLSPFNSVLRKSKTISTGLQKYPNELFEYSSTEGNSQLVTNYTERASIQNNVLSVPYFLPETITFEKKISMFEFQQIVNNPYKLIKFVNEYNEVEYGFIYPSVKPSKEGKFILIKANV